MKQKYDPKLERKNRIEKQIKLFDIFKEAKKSEWWKEYKKLIVEDIRKAKNELTKMRPMTTSQQEINGVMVVLQHEPQYVFNRRFTQMQQFIYDMETFISKPDKVLKEAEEVLTKKKGG